MKISNINIQNMTSIQKVVVSSTLSLIIISIFLHNPLSGYVESNKYEIAYRDAPCTQKYKDQVRENYEEVRRKNKDNMRTDEEQRKYVDRMLQIVCRDRKKSYERKASVPFNKIRSINPVYSWFGYLSNIIQLIVVISLVSCIIYFFSGKQQN